MKLGFDINAFGNKLGTNATRFLNLVFNIFDPNRVLRGTRRHDCGPMNGYVHELPNIITSRGKFKIMLPIILVILTCLNQVNQAGPVVKKLLCPNMTVTMSCREMSCTVDNLEKNWTQCMGYGDCSRMDDLYGHQSAGQLIS